MGRSRLVLLLPEQQFLVGDALAQQEGHHDGYSASAFFSHRSRHSYSRSHSATASAPSAPASYAGAVSPYMARPIACVSTWTVPTTCPMARAAAQAAGLSTASAGALCAACAAFCRGHLYLSRRPGAGPPARPRVDALRPGTAPQRRQVGGERSRWPGPQASGGSAFFQ